VFEKELKARLSRIFKLKKVTFDLPGENPEQECLFISVGQAIIRKKDAKATCRVTGRISVFGNSEKLTYGFMSMAIAEAESEDTRPFYFSEMEENSGRIVNIVERSAQFTYLFDSQYDPSIGTLNEVNLTYVES
jgi:hypothetical protein